MWIKCSKCNKEVERKNPINNAVCEECQNRARKQNYKDKASGNLKYKTTCACGRKLLVPSWKKCNHCRK